MMRAGKLRDKITFSRLTRVSDDAGGSTSTSATLLVCWGQVIRDDSEVVQQSGQNVLKTDYKIVCRRESVASVRKGDIGELDNDSDLKFKINAILRTDIDTITLKGTSIE